MKSQHDGPDFFQRLFQKYSLRTVITVYLLLVGLLWLLFMALLTINLTEPEDFSSVSVVISSIGVLVCSILPFFLRERFMAEKRLMVQNEHLFKCAYMNSHEVRGPLARILGLIELSRLETDIDYRTFFEKMKQEANDIDKIVRMISDDLNKVQQYRHWFPRGMKADS